MVNIKLATEQDIEVLALLGRITYTESHGDFIHDKNDLLNYCTEVFSISKTKQDVNNPNHLFYLIYLDNLPVGYGKLVLNKTNKYVVSSNNCLLERIYILADFIPMKMGQLLLSFLEDKARELQLDTIWLSVYVKNHRAVRFYQKNQFKEVGILNFLVNGKEYENIVFSKNI